jgi:hypothetical protein
MIAYAFTIFINHLAWKQRMEKPMKSLKRDMVFGFIWCRINLLGTTGRQLQPRSNDNRVQETIPYRCLITGKLSKIAKRSGLKPMPRLG